MLVCREHTIDVQFLRDAGTSILKARSLFVYEMAPTKDKFQVSYLEGDVRAVNKR